MDKVQEFKTFIKSQPQVMEKIHSGELTWQKVYEVYDIYGPTNSLFVTKDKEIEDKKVEKNNTTGTKSGPDYVNNALKMFQDIDMDKVTNNLQSIQKVMGIFGEITKGGSKENKPINDIKARHYQRYND